MYFVSIEKLKETLIDGKLSENARFLYLFVFLILVNAIISIFFLMLSYISWFEASAIIEAKQRSVTLEDLEKWLPNVWDISSILIELFLVPILGAIIAYKSNKGNAGRDFMGRFFSIGFVTGIRFIPVYILVLGAFVIYEYYFVPEQDFQSTAINTLPTILLLIAVYWRICKHISDVANATPQST